MNQLMKISVHTLTSMLQNRTVSAVEITQAYLKNIQKQEPALHSFITVTQEAALAKAHAVDAMRMRGEALPPLAGIPAGIKDNICTKGIATTCASRMLEHFIPPFDAHVIQRLSGVPLLGKLNMDEFGMGSSTENSFFGPTHNPLNTTRVPGGSSGGSAAAVAGEEVAFSLGSDTGGSIRQPAAFCGVVGMKPTYGLVSRYGLIAFASSLDQIGPLTRTVRDSAVVLQALAGHDPQDSTSATSDNTDYFSHLEDGVRGLRIAVPNAGFSPAPSHETACAFRKAVSTFERLGAHVEEIPLTWMSEAISAYHILSSVEAASNLARYDGIRFGLQPTDCGNDPLYVTARDQGFGPEVRQRILLGTLLLGTAYRAAYYQQALQTRAGMLKRLKCVFETHDLLLTPVALDTAWHLGQKNNDPFLCAYTVPANLAGLPALSVPCGKDTHGMPIGLQLTGAMFDEGLLYRAAYAFERENTQGEAS